MKIAVGADHAGVRLKDELIAFIESLGHTVSDLAAIARIQSIIRTMPSRCASRWSPGKRTKAFLSAERASA